MLNLFIIKFLSTHDLGVYGLFVTSISIGIIILGLDYYTFNLREILKYDLSVQSKLLSHQFVLYLVTYTLIIPFSFFFFEFEIIPHSYFVIFITVLVFEHIAQELYRVILTLGYPLYANFMLFIRGGSWALVTVTIVYLKFDYVENLQSLLYLWAGASFLTIALSIIKLKRIGIRLFNIRHLEKNIILKGLKVSKLFFIGTIALKLVEFSSRFIANSFLSKEEVGVYIFFQNIANLIFVMVFSGSIMILGPRIIKSYQLNKVLDYNKYFDQLKREIFMYSFGAIIIISVIIHPILSYLSRPELTENIIILWILLGGMLFYNISYYFHYRLYSKHQDRQIVIATLISATFTVITTYHLTANFGLIGTSIGFSSGLFILLISKLFYSKITIK